MGEVGALCAPSTSALQKVLGMLEGFQKQLEKKKTRSAAKLKRVAGKIAAPG